MQNNIFFDLVRGDQKRIVDAITTGAQWEVWMQTEMGVLFVSQGMQAARELPYPPPHANLSLDLLVSQKTGESVAIELKAESATNAGQAGGRPIKAALEADWEKIGHYDCQGLKNRWVCTVAYSSTAKMKIDELKRAHPAQVQTQDFGPLRAVLIDAT
jgi:hypothetical protein